MSNSEDLPTRVCATLVGLLLVVFSTRDIMHSRWSEYSKSDLPRMIIAYVCVWVASLLLKRSLYPNNGASTDSLRVPVDLSRSQSSRSDSRWRRRQPSSSCPKPFTPTTPIRVVSVRPSVSSKSRKQTVQVSSRQVPTSALLIPPRPDTDDTPSDISSYNNESFITGSTECTSWSPVSADAGEESAPASNRPLQIPDSIAAIWEPVEPISSKLW